MALIKCPECGKEVSDTCTKCIHCGYELKKVPSEEENRLSKLYIKEYQMKYKTRIVTGILTSLSGLVFFALLFIDIVRNSQLLVLAVIGLAICVILFGILIVINSLRHLRESQR